MQSQERRHGRARITRIQHDGYEDQCGDTLKDEPLTAEPCDVLVSDRAAIGSVNSQSQHIHLL